MTRNRQLLHCIPDALKYKTLLYVGANRRRQQVLDLFRDRGYRITVLEIWLPNAMYIAKRVSGVQDVVCGDVRNIMREALPLPRYDVVCWWHGPEHIAIEDLAPTLANLEEIAERLVILASPWGRYDQGPVDGNPWEKHRSSIYPDLLRALGYSTHTIGTRDRRGSNLLAWRNTRQRGETG